MISIHALREEGDINMGALKMGLHEISIHALREEGDRRVHAHDRQRLYFYPRPPRGGRPPLILGSLTFAQFLSTPSARRATCRKFPSSTALQYFYPRPPRGGRRDFRFAACKPTGISIHALREEGDLRIQRFYSGGAQFLSTPSARRAT